MLTEIISAIQVGMEAGKFAEGLYNGEHLEDVDRAIDMFNAIDWDGNFEPEVREVLQCLDVVNNDDRLYVKVAAWYLRAKCYAALGDYVKARQNISRVLSVQVDTLTLNKEDIAERQRECRELQKEIKMIEHPEPQHVETKPQGNHQNNSCKKKENKPEPKQNSEEDRQVELYFEYLDAIHEKAFEKAASIGRKADALDEIWYITSPDVVECFWNIHVAPKEIIDYCNRYISVINRALSDSDSDESLNGQLYKLLFYQAQSFRIIGKNQNALDVLSGVPESASLQYPGIGHYLTDEIRGALNIEGESVIHECNKLRSYLSRILSQESVLPTSEQKNTTSPMPINKGRTSSPSEEEQEYVEMYKEYSADGKISERDRKMLDKFRSRLGISEERAHELEESCSKPQLTEDEQEYLEMYKEYAADGEISDRDRKMLNKMRDRMGISEARAKELEKM